jgi:holo-[acyl-carrier protein] synthase
MVIAGIGLDLIEISRIESACKRWGDHFLERVFTRGEIDYCLGKRRPAVSLAARFAAKEAAYKAFAQAGIEIGNWQSVWVESRDDGRPELRCDFEFAGNIHLSLTHGHDIAAAVVVIEA